MSAYGGKRVGEYDTRVRGPGMRVREYDSKSCGAVMLSALRAGFQHTCREPQVGMCEVMPLQVCCLMIQFPSGCRFGLLRPDAVPLWFLRRS